MVTPAVMAPARDALTTTTTDIPAGIGNMTDDMVVAVVTASGQVDRLVAGQPLAAIQQPTTCNKTMVLVLNGNSEISAHV